MERLVLPMVPCTLGAITFNATLVASQGVGKSLGVSCATPIAGPLLGSLAVASASPLAAQVACVIESVIYLKKVTLLTSQKILVHAALGLVLFKALGGQYRNVMPSNLSHPGALARVSIPARSSRYATENESQLIRELYNRYGCHHCGSCKGTSIADHMPPNVVVRNKVAESMSRRTKHVYVLSLERAVRRILDKFHELGLQRFYPQCEECMKKQSAALRHGKRYLVYHFKAGFPEPPYLTGMLLNICCLFN